ncbi:hypothetical protein D9M71_667070 [compost metagenome]
MIVRIEAADISSARPCNSCIACSRRPAIRLAQQLDSRRFQRIQKLEGTRVIRAIINHNDLEVLKALTCQTRKRPRQVPSMVETGNDHAHQRRVLFPWNAGTEFCPPNRSADAEDADG